MRSAFSRKHPISLLMSMRLMLSTLLFVSFISIHAQSLPTLVVWHANGNKTDIELFTMPCITFSSESVLISSDVLDLEYPKEDVLRITFKGNASSIKPLSNEFHFSIINKQLTFHGIKSTDHIALYKVNGIRMPVIFSNMGTEISLSLDSFPAGVYILNICGKTSKIYLK